MNETSKLITTTKLSTRDRKQIVRISFDIFQFNILNAYYNQVFLSKVFSQLRQKNCEDEIC